MSFLARRPGPATRAYPLLGKGRVAPMGLAGCSVDPPFPADGQAMRGFGHAGRAGWHPSYLQHITVQYNTAPDIRVANEAIGPSNSIASL